MAASPSTSTSTTTCRHHRRREAVGTCVACGKPLCRDCMNPTGVGFKCAPCTGGKVGRGATSRTRATGGGAPAWLAPGALAVVVAVVLGVIAANVFGGDGGRATGVPADEISGGGAPVGAVERRVQFAGAGEVSIGGTLALPQLDAATEAGVAGVVIIPGFGPTTRDGVVAPGTVPDPFYQDLSASFTEAGMATLRYDKRGSGQSVLPPDEALAFDDMVVDAGAAVTFLAERAEVDPERIAVVGHEEGGLVALDLAGSDPRVGSLVLVSVPGRPLLDVLTDDFSASGHGEEVAGLQAVVSGLLAGQGLPDQTELPPFLRNFFPTAQEGYLEDIFSLDPVALASGVEAPAMVVRGASATGVSEADGQALAAALGPETEVVVAADAGSTLRVVDPLTAGEDSSNPNSASHDHGAGAPVVTRERDTGVMAAITEFLSGSLA